MSFLEMKDFVEYNPETGNITTWGSMGVGGIVNSQLHGRLMIEGFGRPETHKVDLETLTIVPIEEEAP